MRTALHRPIALALALAATASLAGLAGPAVAAPAAGAQAATGPTVDDLVPLETATTDLRTVLDATGRSSHPDPTTTARLQSQLAALAPLAREAAAAHEPAHAASSGGTADPATTVLADARAAVRDARAVIAEAPAADDAVTVTFDSAGGSAVAPQQVTAGGTLAEPAHPTKEGVVFVGWYTDAATVGHLWDFRNNTVLDATTLHAKWVRVDATHRLLNAYASDDELASPYVAATLQTLGTLSDDQRHLTLPAGTTVYVAPGVYWTDLTYREGGVIDPPNVGLSILGDDVALLGLTDDATDAIVAGNRGEGGETGLGANGSWYSLGVSSGFRSENLTIANYAQQDLVYPRDPSQDVAKRIDSKNHAEVLTRADGTGTPDRLTFDNTRFVGYLNMMANLTPARAYFKDSFFQLTDDSIFSGGTNVYEHCTFHFFGNHPSYSGADDGGIAVLLDSTVVGMPQMTATDLYLAKQSNAIGPDADAIFAVLDTQFTGRIQSVEWENVVREDARHFVSNNTIGDDAKPLVISPSQPQTSVTLTGDALDAFKVGDVYNVYNLLKGDDGWDPTHQHDAAWEPYSNLPYRFLVGAAGKTLYSDRTDDTNRAVLTPAPAPVGSVDARATSWSYDRDLLDGTVDAATGAITLTAKPNRTGAVVKTIVTGTLPSGLSAGATLSVRPVTVPAPVVSSPAIAIGKNVATLRYTLDQLGYKDTSVIDWYRESGPDTTDGVHIGTMRNDAAGFFVDDPYTDYDLSTYDVGSYLRAVITPKYEFSGAGAPVTVRTTRAVTAADVTDATLHTDFRNLFLTDEDHLTTQGRWFFDRVSGTAVPWGWGIGTNGTDKVWGLQNNTGGTGTRLVLGQPGSYGDMSFTVDYSSSKVEGQGFGGNGQFLDLYVKYDPATRTGYGLHVERTAAGGSNATTWTLARFDGETRTALTEPQRTAAFMPKSTVSVFVAGDTLGVTASTLSSRTPLQVEQGLANTVDLSWTDDTGALAQSTAGGVGIRINNSGNSSYDYAGSGTATNNTVMLHDVSVDASPRTGVVTFDADGGTETAAVTVPLGGAVARPADPTRGADLFAGWFADAACRTPYDFDSPVTGDLTLHACWETLVSAVPSAAVERLPGPTDSLTVTVTETYSRGTVKRVADTFRVPNNAADTYAVGRYRVSVDTKGGKVREVRIVG
ncbi:InlB B-repeat-containing protein [Luteimicrobium sp. DT211]|uniref:InlB B-repeat-containing protein n=1 Tax=Luteimicrobium sp. DT211 TaxID=3393412 RepID=UPI003CEF0FF6